MTRRRVFAVVVLLVASGFSIYGFLRYAAAALPYQDPTPELLQAQAAQIRAWQLLFIGSGAVAIAALISLRRSRRARRQI